MFGGKFAAVHRQRLNSAWTGCVQAFWFSDLIIISDTFSYVCSGIFCIDTAVSQHLNPMLKEWINIRMPVHRGFRAIPCLAIRLFRFPGSHLVG